MGDVVPFRRKDLRERLMEAFDKEPGPYLSETTVVNEFGSVTVSMSCNIPGVTVVSSGLQVVPNLTEVPPR